MLTDGRLYIGEAGEVFKAFHVLDGHGLKLLARVGITAHRGHHRPRFTRGAPARGRPGPEADAHYGVADKLAVADAACWPSWPGLAEVAVIGDDWPDLPLLARAGFACAPANAHAEARALAHHVTTARGGEGAAREFCDLLLAGQRPLC